MLIKVKAINSTEIIKLSFDQAFTMALKSYCDQYLQINLRKLLNLLFAGLPAVFLGLKDIIIVPAVSLPGASMLYLIL